METLPQKERKENSCFNNNKRMILEGYLLGKTGFPKITNRTQLAEIFKCDRKTIYNEIIGTIFEYNAEYAQNIANERNANRGMIPKIMLDTALARKLKHYIVDKKYSPYATLAELNIKGWPSETRAVEKTLYNWVNDGLKIRMSLVRFQPVALGF